MRSLLFALAVPFAFLGACGGPETSQANNAQANISEDSRVADNAVASNLQLRLSMGDAAKVMHARHEGMEAIGKATKAINRELKGSSPDLGVVRSSAAQMASLARASSGWFPAGTGPEVGKTGAKPDIWSPQNKADFAAKLRNFQGAAQAFNAAAKGGDAGAINARFADLGGTCKACHDKYRMDMHH
ncbi:MAG TPA: cytochrome c [Sphingomicrobium sp.]